MNVQSSDWLRVFPNAKNPLASALAGVFTIPADEPRELKVLLNQIKKGPRP